MSRACAMLFAEWTFLKLQVMSSLRAVVFLVVVLLFVLSRDPVRANMSAGISRGAGFGRGDPTNTWAVEITGGDEKADEIAKKYGFKNLGKVGNLKTVYHFEMPVDKLNSFGSRELLDNHLSGLSTENLVTMVERQYRRHFVPKKD